MHPAEFLVTGPDGAILDLRMFGDPERGGDALRVAESEIGGPEDRNAVCCVDLPVVRLPGAG